jgi:hypothetical protein
MREAGMRIIDVDSHFNEPYGWFEQANPGLAAKLPRMTVSEQFLDIFAGDLLASVPPQLLRDPPALVPEYVRESCERFLSGEGERHFSDARLRHLCEYECSSVIQGWVFAAQAVSRIGGNAGGSARSQ